MRLPSCNISIDLKDFPVAYRFHVDLVFGADGWAVAQKIFKHRHRESALAALGSRAG